MKNRKTKIFILLLLLLVVFLIYLRSIATDKDSTVPNQDQPLVLVEQAVPGSTKLGELLFLKDPIYKSQNEKGYEVYVGEKDDPLYTIIRTDGETVSEIIIREPYQFEFSSLKDFQQKYGASIVRYGPLEKAGYISYVFLEKGLVIVSHPFSETVAEIWIIVPGLTEIKFNNLYNESFSKALSPVVEIEELGQ